MTKHPAMFIGSSSEGKSIGEYWQAALVGYCDADVWDQHVFKPSGETLGRLLSASAEYDFATLVLTPDDLVEKRGREGLAPRDNVVFELGMFMAALGRDRVFILKDSAHSLSLPSDLLGVTTLQYSGRSKPNLRAQLNPPALEAREIMEHLGLKDRRHGEAGADSLKFVADIASGLANGAAGLRITVCDSAAQNVWRGNLLAMLAELFTTRTPDAYAAWLRPKDAASGLELYMSRNLPDDYDHYTFHRDEGLAGKVWTRGVAAAHSKLQPHPWWIFREGCENVTYLCASVGDAGRSGGVLAIGSDSGFESVPHDLKVVELFASVLSASLDDTVADEKQILRERVSQLDSSLSAYTASRTAHRREIKIHDLIVGAAQQALTDDPIIMALEKLGGSEEGTMVCGTLRMNLAQILAVI